MANRKAKRVKTWREVPQQVFAEFEKEVYKLRDRLVPTDAEGDSPVQIIIVNRLEFENLHFQPLLRVEPYRSSYDPPEKRLTSDELQAREEAAERSLASNLKLAALQLERHIEAKHQRQRQERITRMPLKQQVKELCRYCRNGDPLAPVRKGFKPLYNVATTHQVKPYGQKGRTEEHMCEAVEQRRALALEASAGEEVLFDE